MNNVVKDTLVGLKRARPAGTVDDKNKDDMDDFLGKLKRPKTQLH